MRTLKTIWFRRLVAACFFGFAMLVQVATVSGQSPALFSPPVAGQGAATVKPTVAIAANVAATSGESVKVAKALFDVPQFVVAEGKNGNTVKPLSVVAPDVPEGATAIRQVANTVAVPMATPAMPTPMPPLNGWAGAPQAGYQSATTLWGGKQVAFTAPNYVVPSQQAAAPIGAYVVTESGLQPVGCSGPVPSGLQGVDLSNLNPDGCSAGSAGYAMAPSYVAAGATGGGCCGCGGCGGGCGHGGKSCGHKRCGHGGCGLKSCGGGCGGGCGLGSCCGGQMCCTSAACKNCQCDGLCGCDCCRPRFWARVDALLWYMQGYSTPALVTRSPGGTPQNIAGVLGNGSTQILGGNQDFGDGLRPGGRLRMGYWFDPCRKFGIQGDFFALGNGGDSARFNGNGTDSFARPFFNTNPDVNAQDSQIFSRPGLAQGSLDISTSSSVISAGPALRWNLCCCQGNDGCCNPRSRRVDLLLGYRFFRVEEEFASREILLPTDGLFVAGTRYELNDRITTENEFHGIEFGLAHMYQRGQWRWDIASVLAVGEVQRSVTLDGSTRITVPGFQDNTLPGGFFVGPDDIGRFEDRDYALIPQVRTNLSYCLGCNWRLGVGYDFMYLSSAFRPDAYLNTAFDGSRLARQPTIGVVGDPVVTRKSDLFLHGVNVNLTYNF